MLNIRSNNQQIITLFGVNIKMNEIYTKERLYGNIKANMKCVLKLIEDI